MQLRPTVNSSISMTAFLFVILKKSNMTKSSITKGNILGNGSYKYEDS